MSDRSEEVEKVIERGKRLRLLRCLTGMVNLQDFAEKYDFSSSTLSYWEKATSGGLTEKGAKSIIAAVKNEGIECSSIWLMEGIGEPPRITDYNKHSIIKELSKDLDSGLDVSEDENLQQEIGLFKKLHPAYLIVTVNDDAMAPIYMPSDILGGKKHTSKNLEDIVDKDCIVEIDHNTFLVRRVKSGKKSGTFDLYSVNPARFTDFPPILDKKILSIAPITRVWRKKTND